MIQGILNILEGIGQAFTSIGNIISIIYKGMLDIPNLVNYAFENANRAISWAIPITIIPIISVCLCVVVIYKIFGRT